MYINKLCQFFPKNVLAFMIVGYVSATQIGAICSDTTFQYAGTEGKRHRLREAMLFRDPPEYYNPSGN